MQFLGYIKCGLAWSVLLSTTICVITVVKMLWTREAQHNIKDSKRDFCQDLLTIGHLHDLVTWHGINYTGSQITQWDFQNKGKSGWTGTSSFVLEVPVRNLRPSVIYSVPCDRIV